MADQEIVTLGWSETVVHTFKDVQIDADALRQIFTEHVPRLTNDVNTPMLSDKLDWMNDQETHAVTTAIKAYLAGQGNAVEGELESEASEDVEHDAEDLSEHDECEGGCGYHPDNCACEDEEDDEDDEDEDADEDEDDGDED